MHEPPAFATAWLQQRTAAAAAVEAVEAAELANLDDATALRLADALLSATPLDAIAEERRMTSGLIEQQRLFACSRR